MKQFVRIFFALICSFYSSAQDTIQLNHHTWAGGVCCSSGDDFTLNFPFNLSQQNIDSVWVLAPGRLIHLSEQQLKASNKNCTATFGWSTTERYNNESYTTYYGIEEKDLSDYEYSVYVPTITVFYSNGKKEELPLNYQFSMTAYP